MQIKETLKSTIIINSKITTTPIQGDINMITGTSALKTQLNINNEVKLLETKGWERQSLGKYRSNGQIKEKQGFKLYKRSRKLQDYIDDYSQKSSFTNTRKPRKDWANTPGLSSPLGIPEPKLTPLACEKGGNCLGSSSNDEKQLPALSSFSSYDSLTATRRDKPCILIGYDSEWENTESGRNMISWQFALVENDDLIEFVFLKDGDKDLTLNFALGTILDQLESYKPIYICPLKYLEAKPYTDRDPEYIEKIMHQADHLDNNILDKIIVASAKSRLGLEEDDFGTYIKELQTIGQQELKMKKEKEEKHLMDMVKQYEDSIYLEVLNPERGDKAAFHFGDRVGIMNAHLHVGSYNNDSILYQFYDDKYEIDFRYFPEGYGSYMKSYCWSEDIKLIVIKNISESRIYFNNEKIEVQETKLFNRSEMDELTRRGMF